MRRFYSDFAAHCMRFFVRYPDPKFRSDVDKKNWHACDKALKAFTPNDRKILIDIYADDGKISDNVRKVCSERDLDLDDTWLLVSRLEGKIARRRGIL